jgi:dTDP-4-dehydrorhamnose reductase
MKVLVTGREGQLARSLVERSQGVPGIELVAVGRPELDLREPDSIRRAVRAASPDVIVSAAAYTAVDQAEDEPELAMRINGDAAGELAAASRIRGARIIQISTDYVFDGSARDPYSESAPVNPLGAYGRSKLAGEEQVRLKNPEHAIIRTAWVYSPFGRNFLKTMMALARDKDSLSVVSDQYGNPSSALDLADGLLALLKRWSGDTSAGVGETYHLAGSGSASWSQFAEHVLEESRSRGAPSATVQPISTAEWPTKAARPVNSTLNCEKFSRDFGFTMPRWRLSASQTVGRLAGQH